MTCCTNNLLVLSPSMYIHHLGMSLYSTELGCISTKISSSLLYLIPSSTMTFIKNPSINDFLMESLFITCEALKSTFVAAFIAALHFLYRRTALFSSLVFNECFADHLSPFLRNKSKIFKYECKSPCSLLNGSCTCSSCFLFFVRKSSLTWHIEIIFSTGTRHLKSNAEETTLRYRGCNGTSLKVSAELSNRPQLFINDNWNSCTTAQFNKYKLGLLK
eukprot:NODE_9_length_47730_cov_0.323718.p22 type:complete len:218 gc:universal NODE_9_length_47730_cov_0.323718:42937-42284(-)